jgi:hypothetical protein
MNRRLELGDRTAELVCRSVRVEAGTAGVSRYHRIPPERSLGDRLLFVSHWRPLLSGDATQTRNWEIQQGRGIQRWRDPDSNRGHHDFQSWSRISLTAAEPLQIRGLARGDRGGWIAANRGLFSPIWALRRVSVPNQIAQSRYVPWRRNDSRNTRVGDNWRNRRGGRRQTLRTAQLELAQRQRKRTALRASLPGLDRFEGETIHSSAFASRIP